MNEKWKEMENMLNGLASLDLVYLWNFYFLMILQK
jgi:hypothetical protein